MPPVSWTLLPVDRVYLALRVATSSTTLTTILHNNSSCRSINIRSIGAHIHSIIPFSFVCLRLYLSGSLIGRSPSMANQVSIMAPVLLLFCLTLGSWQVQAADPELLTDFSPPADDGQVDANFFTNQNLSAVFANPAAKADFATVTAVNVQGFPALLGLGVSTALLQFPPGSVNPPHTHPRGTEVLFVIEGCLDVGLVLSNTTLFTQTLFKGDLFVFPRGLVHFQKNSGNDQVVAYASFSSAGPGLVRLPNVLFKSNIDDSILAQSFGVSPKVIEALEAGIVDNPPAK